MPQCSQPKKSKTSMLRVPTLQIARPVLFRGPVVLSRSRNSSIVLSSRNTRPLWFDGRFLAAVDLQREQNYFLQRQASLGRAAGYGVLHGLSVDQQLPNNQPASAETIVIRAGDGITPSGELVMIPEDLTIQLSDLADEENLDVQFGLSETPQQPQRTRTGIYVIALRPVQFTANPITTYPANLQSPRIAQDGDVIEATAVSLVPYPNPVNNFDASLQQAALARQIFVLGNNPKLPDSLLPLAMISIDRNVIQWIDMYLVRRDSSPEISGVQPGLADAATQQAYIRQYSARLNAVVSGLPAGTAFPASDHFQALPPAGSVPFAALNVKSFSQVFFPQQARVTLSVVPSDEIPALLQESMSLPPIDLTLPANAYANVSLLVLVPIPRANFAAVRSTVQDVQLNPPLPQIIPGRRFPPLIRLLPGAVRSAVTPAPANGWPTVIGGLTYGFYVRQRDEPVFVDFTTASTTSSGA